MTEGSDDAALARDAVVSDDVLADRLARHAVRLRTVAAARAFVGGRARLERLAARAGVTPAVLLADARRAHARVLLRWGDAPAEQIARLTGHRSVAQLVDETGALPSPRRARGVVRACLFCPAAQPFAHEALLSFLAQRGMPPVEGVVDRDSDPGYRRNWRSAGGSGSVVYRLGADGVLVEIQGRGVLPVRELLARVRRMFDPGAPIADIDGQLGADPVLAPAVRATPGRRVPGHWDPFELAVRAILGQQVSVVAARTHAIRLLELLGVSGSASQGVAAGAYFPTPAELAAADLDALAMPGARKRALGTLAEAVADGRVDFDAPTDEVWRALVALKGIGPWTADYVAMRALGDRDAFPAGDLVVRQALADDRRKLPSEKAVRERSAPWRPYRAYATLHLWSIVGAGG